jgi:hypothetical protein
MVRELLAEELNPKDLFIYIESDMNEKNRKLVIIWKGPYNKKSYEKIEVKLDKYSQPKYILRSKQKDWRYKYKDTKD